MRMADNPTTSRPVIWILHALGIVNRLGAKTWLLTAFVAIAAVIRFWNLGSNPPSLWFDETTGYYIPFMVTHGVMASNIWQLIHSTPPSGIEALYYLVTSAVQGPLWVAWLPHTSQAWIVRLPVVIYGVALIALLFFVGIELRGYAGGVAAASLGVAVPWTTYYSRYLVPVASMEFWTMLAIYLLLLALRRRSRALGLSSIFAGTLVVYTHAAGLAVFGLLLIPAWLLGAFYNQRLSLDIHSLRLVLARVWKFIPEIAVAVITLFPLIVLDIQTQPGTGALSGSFYIWQTCHSTQCVVTSWMQRSALSWSPDFLGLTGGMGYATVNGFNVHISIGGVYQSGGGYTGVLGWTGLLLYPALCYYLLAYPIYRRAKFEFILATLSILSFSFVGGVVNNDNPNAARLAFAAGPFITLLSMFLLDSLTWMFQRFSFSKLRSQPLTFRKFVPARHDPPVQRTRVRSATLALALVIAVVLSSAVPYLTWFYGTYPVEARQAFIPEIKVAAHQLSAHNLWNEEIEILAGKNLSYIVQGELAFYDPIQPPPWPITLLPGSVSKDGGLLIQQRPTTFISFTGNATSNLSASGVPYEFVAAATGVWIYRIIGLGSLQTPIASVTRWTDSPGINASAPNLSWTVSHPMANGTTIITPTVNGVEIKADLERTSMSEYWQVTAKFPTAVLLAKANIFQIAWNETSFGGSGVLNAEALIDSNGSTVESNAILDYPATIINIGTASRYGLSSTSTGVVLGASLQPGSSEVVNISWVSVHGVTAVLTPSCATSESTAISGSKFDVAYSTDGGLVFNANTARLSVTLCVPPTSIPPGDQVYFRFSFITLQDFSEPMSLTFSGPFLNQSISGIDGVSGPTYSVLTRIGTQSGILSGKFSLTFGFVGKALIETIAIQATSPT